MITNGRLAIKRARGMEMVSVGIFGTYVAKIKERQPMLYAVLDTFLRPRQGISPLSSNLCTPRISLGLAVTFHNPYNYMLYGTITLISIINLVITYLDL